MRGVGSALAERLQRLGISQVQDLLFVLPLRYEDRTRVWQIGALTPGIRGTVEGEVQLTEVAYRRRRQMLCRISDGSGFLTLRFFHFSAAQQNGLPRGARIRCFGEIRRGPAGLEIVHPEYRRVTDAAAPLEETLTPIYPLTDFTMKLVAWEEGNKGNPGVTPEVADEVRRTYLPDGDLENPMASVLFADHTGLPPALVVTCEHDILRNEGVALAESYVKAGVETRHLHMDDQPHGYLLMTRLTKRSYETIDAMIAEAKKHL